MKQPANSYIDKATVFKYSFIFILILILLISACASRYQSGQSSSGGNLIVPAHLHWGVAYLGNDFREHNSVVVTAKGQEFSEGIVLDPWRNSGKLYWANVKDDHYPWKKRQPNE